MAWRVNWTESAWADLEETAAYIARDSEHYMSAFIRRARETVRSLQNFPYRGRVVPEFGDVVDSVAELSCDQLPPHLERLLLADILRARGPFHKILAIKRIFDLRT